MKQLKTLIFNMLHPLFVSFYEQIVDIIMNDEEIQELIMNLLHQINLNTNDLNSSNEKLTDEQKANIKNILVNQLSENVRKIADSIFLKAFNL